MGDYKMEQESQRHIISELIAGFMKIWTWVACLFIGLVGKIGEMLQDGKQRSWQQFIGNLLVSLVMGFLSVVFFASHYPAAEGSGVSPAGAMGVVLATLLSDRVALFLFNVNWVPVLEILSGKKSKKP